MICYRMMHKTQEAALLSGRSCNLMHDLEAVFQEIDPKQVLKFFEILQKKTEDETGVYINTLDEGYVLLSLC